MRERKNDEARNRIADAVIQLVADATGISRRTIYRYFPDRDSLLATASTRVREMAGNRLAFPGDEQSLLDTHSIYTGLDRIALVATLVRSTPQSRAIRLSQKRERQESYLAATADAV